MSDHGNADEVAEPTEFEPVIPPARSVETDETGELSEPLARSAEATEDIVPSISADQDKDADPEPVVDNNNNAKESLPPVASSGPEQVSEEDTAAGQDKPQDDADCAQPDAEDEEQEESGGEHNLFDLNDPEQLRFIADRLENVDGMAMDEDMQQHDAYMTMDELGAAQEPSMLLRLQSMPILDNLSTQILTTLGRGPYQETFNIVTQPESDQGQAYRTLKSLFDQTKRLYSHDGFLNSSVLGPVVSVRHKNIIRKANLATFVSAVFGSTEVGFYHLNEYFLDSFVPEGSRMLKSQGALYLELKTHSFISAMSQNERTKTEILDDLFPDDLDQYILSRKIGSKSLSPGEVDFITRCKGRRDTLETCDPDENLLDRYFWHSFLKDVSEYVAKNLPTLISTVPQTHHNLLDSSTDSGSRAQRHHPPAKRQRRTEPFPDSSEVPEFAIEGTLVSATPVGAGHEASTSHGHASGDAEAEADDANVGDYDVSNAELTKTGRGRAAASVGGGSGGRRRPWSKEEEAALMKGLEEVKGPRWSQILEMYGPGGRISEVLKDRTQVQLKDKARNLKLFFLKSGLQVPYYLRFVTGELKTKK
ncbi:telomere repeat binding factor-domain-containing protein [Limtongia smithiae]|uniref:telomere repeat binding factor-domain-containing protein n=1 Tax=Limtongia smithiae TaxID=1125753 RepID=UPI0034CE0EE0